MDYRDIVSRIEIIIDAIEYEEMELEEVKTSLTDLVMDVESSTAYEDSFEFEDLD